MKDNENAFHFASKISGFALTLCFVELGLENAWKLIGKTANEFQQSMSKVWNLKLSVDLWADL